MLNPQTIQTISGFVQKKFPEMFGVTPDIKQRPVSSNAEKKSVDHSNATYLLVYQKKVSAVDGHTISRWVRVVANSQGEIIRITTSR